jgi:hypothetical protein
MSSLPATVTSLESTRVLALEVLEGCSLIMVDCEVERLKVFAKGAKCVSLSSGMMLDYRNKTDTGNTSLFDIPHDIAASQWWWGGLWRGGEGARLLAAKGSGERVRDCLQKAARDGGSNFGTRKA